MSPRLTLRLIWPSVWLALGSVPVATATATDAVTEMPALVLTVNNPQTVALPFLPGALQFPPEPIRLIRSRFDRTWTLRSVIAANRRRSKLRAAQTLTVDVANDFYRLAQNAAGPRSGPPSDRPPR